MADINQMFNEQFMMRLRNEITAHLIACCASNQQSIIDKYVNQIYDASIKDPDYLEMIRDDSFPLQWKNDWFREFIDLYSDLYSVYIEGESKIDQN